MNIEEIKKELNDAMCFSMGARQATDHPESKNAFNAIVNTLSRIHDTICEDENNKKPTTGLFGNELQNQIHKRMMDDIYLTINTLNERIRDCERIINCKKHTWSHSPVSNSSGAVCLNCGLFKE